MIPAVRLTIHLGEAERATRRLLFTSVLSALHDCGLMGATMTRGVMGYGRSRRISSSMQEIPNLPLTIETVDEPAKVEIVLPRLVDILAGRGLVQVQQTSIVGNPKRRWLNEEEGSYHA